MRLLPCRELIEISTSGLLSLQTQIYSKSNLQEDEEASLAWRTHGRQELEAGKEVTGLGWGICELFRTMGGGYRLWWGLPLSFLLPLPLPLHQP